MIVCICNRITEEQVREAARAGALTPEKAYVCLSAAVQCGSCLDYAADIICEERRETLAVTAEAA